MFQCHPLIVLQIEPRASHFSDRRKGLNDTGWLENRINDDAGQQKQFEIFRVQNLGRLLQVAAFSMLEGDGEIHNEKIAYFE